MNKKVLGIDLGTTNSCISVIEDNKKIKIITNNEGKHTTPSVIGFNKDGSIVIGEIATRQACTNSQNTIYAFKRLIGKKYDEVSNLIDKVSYKIVPDKNNNAAVEVNGKIYSPIEISAKLLKYLAEIGAKYLGQNLSKTKVVITVPAYFNQLQKESTKSAGQIADLEVERIINEPTAAALAYGLEEIGKDSKNKYVLIYDLGGGTFDVSILSIEGGAFYVEATHGNPNLGGEDFDIKLVTYVLNKFTQQHPNNNIKSDKAAMYRVKEACKNAKQELSDVMITQTSITVPYICMGASGPLNLDITVTRNEFESLIRNDITDTINRTREVCKKANLTEEEINAVVMVGGSSRIPLIYRELVAIFGESKIKNNINPDEAIAIGAAIQGSIISGENTDVVLIDSTSLDLGIESLGGVMSTIIKSGSPLPIKKSQTFTTSTENQETAEISIYQGERPLVKDNIKLGSFVLTGIRRAAKGIPQIEVTFEMDANSLLNVTAMDKDTNKSQNILLKPEVGLTPEEIERMKEEAKKHHDKDQEEKALIIAKHDLESKIFTIDKELENIKEKTPELNDKINTYKQETNKILNDNNVKDIKIYTEQSNKGDEIIRELMSLNKTNTNNNTQENTNTNTNSGNNNQEEPKVENPEEDTNK